MDKCTSCGLCTTNCAASLDTNRAALGGSMRSDGCIPFGSCASTCPKEAVAFAPK
ncbi:MAG: 4Fe-4S dicluster domain-containing protein [Thermoplasmata archaeon]